MDETTFLNSGDVTVTNARFIVGSKTYAMNGVTSASSKEVKPNRIGPILGLLVGIALAFGNDSGMKGFGFVLIVIFAVVLYFQKSTHAVVLQSSSGEVQALSSKDGNHITSVVSALNNSLIHRG